MTNRINTTNDRGIRSVTGTNDDGTEWAMYVGETVKTVGAGDDDETGRVVAFTSVDVAEVAWESGVTTPVDVARLVSLS